MSCDSVSADCFSFNQYAVSHISSAIIFIIFRDFFMFTKFYFHHKWCPIVTYKYGICELPHDLPDSLKLSILVN